MHDDTSIRSAQCGASPTHLNLTNQPSVLIIDDHEGTLHAYSRALRLSGFVTVEAATGREGLALARARAIDVILVDLRLPDMSGLEVVRELKLSRVGARIVIVTAFPTLDTSFDAAVAGADGYVDGPLFGDEIVAVVSQALNGSLPVRHPSRSGVSQMSVPILAIDSRVREMMQLIAADLARPWSVGELSSNVGLSESRLRTLFLASSGVSVTAYIRERRLQVAARRLIGSSDNVRQIAYGVGFNSSSLRDFRRAFRERFGMSPTTYRRRLSHSPIPSCGRLE